ncbi:hypothetical protein LK13_17390 [Paenibacillus polymyxa]|uniref:hypothetical protein n=1 Tax=Paenibacillus polymyxa TaxID=1406 RepID=UPI00042EA3C1|nr:hypothetical protein [Paenibacillus polymyxa]AHM64557.1 hypothetical protein PPSQR21_008970 [Paenibacillus polymyxa SQR-21]AIY10199.1 hypothetical protein LK13_17390 [Paenibacillus polymyxa]
MTSLASTVVFISAMAFIIELIIIYLVTSLILNSSTIVVMAGFLIGIPLSFALMGGLMKALENSLIFSIPVMIDPLYVIVGFVAVMLYYELSKLLCRRKVNAISMSEALKAGTE